MSGSFGNWEINIPNYARYNSLEEFAAAVLDYILIFAGILAVVAMIYSGLRFITAGSDAEAAATARKNLMWAVIGIVIILLALLVINWVQGILQSGSAG